jgi:hypothetical protein
MAHQQRRRAGSGITTYQGGLTMPATATQRAALSVLRVIVDEDPATAPERAIRASYLDASELTDVLDLDVGEAQKITGALQRGIPYSDQDGEYERCYLIPAPTIHNPPPGDIVSAHSTPEPPAAATSQAQALRLARLREAVKHGAGQASPPNEIYDQATQEMLDGTRPPGRYLCATAEHGHESNPDYTVADSLPAACACLDRALSGEAGTWLPLALVDLDTAGDLIDQVELCARIHTPTAPPHSNGEA